MDKEDKKLLMKDLCARLPYGVQVFVEHDKYAQATLRWSMGNKNGQF